MNLKQIELQGFKSFQSKVVFKIDSNLIGIVGPNGSGKSNIIDAIRWVLGEQSAKNLRGSSMKDVIFSGTLEKKGKNFAEVSLTFDINGEENVITRRLYRNGDSEYLHNGKKKRLKEITDIYFDLGINKESYSIITQGKVENILAAKPIDRRVIVEEAAGILKYKLKKKEANTKLEKTHDNIRRLNDIFSEIKERYLILDEQQQITQKYLNYKEELEKKDIFLKVYDIKDYKNQIEDLISEREEYKNKKNQLEKNIDVLDHEINKIRTSIVEIDDKYSHIKDTYVFNVQNKEKKQALLEIGKERINNKEETLKKLLVDKQEQEDKKQELSEQRELLVKEISNQEQKLLEIQEKLSPLLIYDKNKLKQLDIEIEKIKDDYFHSINSESKLENELKLLESLKRNTDATIGTATEEIKQLQEELNSKTVELEEIKNSITLVNNEVEDNKTLASSFLAEQAKIKNEFNSILAKIEQGKNLASKLISKKEFLENQNANLDVYNIGVKEILNNKDKISGIHSTVGDILTFNKEYSISLDIALGTAQQNIIVDNSETARHCVEHLKNKQKGRATFLPISNINNRYFDNNLLKTLKVKDGFIDIASNLVSVDSKYNNIVSHLLGTVLIVDNLKNGNNIAKNINFKYRIVTLDGQVINSGGSITGGSIYKNNNSIIKNKAELNEVENNLQQVEDKLLVLNTNLQKLEKKLLDINSNIDTSQTIIQNKDIESKELDLRHNLLVEQINKLELTLNSEKYRLEDYNNNNLHDNSFEELLTKIKDLKNHIKTLNNELANKNKLRLELSKENSNVEEELQQLKIEKNSLEANIAYKKQLETNIKKDIIYIEEKLKQLSLDYDKLQYSDSEFEALEKEYIKDIKEYDKILITLKKEEDAIKQEKDNLYILEVENQKKSKQFYNDLEITNSNLEKINIKLSKLEVKIEEILIYLGNTYNTTYEKAEQKLADVSIQEIANYKVIIKTLKNKIEQLGNVNLNAIEEYNEVAERYNFYKNEIDDLLEAQDKLQHTIAEIDKEVSERFIKTFNEVANNFSKIYKMLFNGGEATMTLENPKDILNTGIIVEASPPGKKLQNLSLLSGGEKSLTAIALLFAILEIKASPFVILDEVEAALDEVNVLRFAKFLKHYSENNKFLVITHRRGTMEQMDKLYGVTMKEQGISYILPLELKNILKEDYVNE